MFNPPPPPSPPTPRCFWTRGLALTLSWSLLPVPCVQEALSRAYPRSSVTARAADSVPHFPSTSSNLLKFLPIRRLDLNTCPYFKGRPLAQAPVSSIPPYSQFFAGTLQQNFGHTLHCFSLRLIQFLFPPDTFGLLYPVEMRLKNFCCIVPLL